ncbi:MAG TPA: integrase arm-type DNA-binding domain-containing protein [Rhizomicrobium sp.]|nr:integrase arm-type DNA-binding domain-containing protein [Rhizomicrobium sp.]
MALTDAKLRALKPAAADYKVADGEGLYLLVATGGGKRWRLAYRFEGKQKALALGVYPKVSLLDARKARDHAKRKLSEGIDPGIERKEKKQAQATRSANTFKALANEWFEVKSSGWVESYSLRLRSRLDEDLIANLGDRPIADIRPLEVLQVLRGIEDRGAIEMAKRIKQMASLIFCYAVATERCENDPTASLRGVLKPPNPTKHRAALKTHELPQFMCALRDYDGDETTRLGLSLIVHTLVRTSELIFGKWSEFEQLEGREPLWRIPEERMKMRRMHLVPLSPQAVSTLLVLKKITGDQEYLLPGDTRTGTISQNTLIYALYRMGYHSRATVHGFRSTASTVLNEQLFNRDWIEMQLAHFDGSVRGHYNAAEWLPGRREMMRWWGNFVEEGAARHAQLAA